MTTMIEYGDDRRVAETALRDPQPGLEVIRRMFGLAVWACDGLPGDDPMREVIVSVGKLACHALDDLPEED